MVKFILPGFYENYHLNIDLLNMMKQYPEYFYDNIEIEAFYGNFQFCIFDGGRIFTDYRQTNLEEIKTIIYNYNEIFEKPLRLVFTNPILEPKHFTDRFGNICLAECENSFNEIVINNSEFEKYVREKYPNYSFISSTTKCLNHFEDLERELNNPNYKMVCLDYNLNKNKKVLELPEEIRHKCEFLVNAICPPGCLNRKEHYKLNGLYSLTYGKSYGVN